MSIYWYCPYTCYWNNIFFVKYFVWASNYICAPCYWAPLNHWRHTEHIVNIHSKIPNFFVCWYGMLFTFHWFLYVFDMFVEFNAIKWLWTCERERKKHQSKWIRTLHTFFSRLNCTLFKSHFAGAHLCRMQT